MSELKYKSRYLGAEIDEMLGEISKTQGYAARAENAAVIAEQAAETVAEAKHQNLCKLLPGTAFESETLSVSVSEDGVIVIDGTTEIVEAFELVPELGGDYMLSRKKILPNGEYILDHNVGENETHFAVVKKDANGDPTGLYSATNEEEESVSFTVADTDKYISYVLIIGAGTYDHAEVRPLIRYANDSDSSWKPYSYSFSEKVKDIEISDLHSEIDAINTRDGVQVSGGLPLTFSSLGGNMSDWQITAGSLGAGEPTKNLLDTTNVDVTSYDVRVYTDNNRIHVSGTFSKTSGNSVISIASITLLSGTYTVSGADADIYSDYGYRLQVIDATGDGAVTLGYDSGEGYTFELSSETLIGIRVHITGTKAYNVPVDFVFPVMLRSADTDNSFIPYGYQIPIVVTSGANTTETNIYIGESSLSPGESVSRNSTGQEIPVAASGLNTIDTNSPYKPTAVIIPDNYAKLVSAIAGGGGGSGRANQNLRNVVSSSSREVV